MYRTVVTICTASLTHNNSTFCPHSVFMCFVWISEQTAIISLYSINWLVCITETECVYCAVGLGMFWVFITETESVHCSVRAEYLNVIRFNFILQSTRSLAKWLFTTPSNKTRSAFFKVSAYFRAIIGWLCCAVLCCLRQCSQYVYLSR